MYNLVNNKNQARSPLRKNNAQLKAAHSSSLCNIVHDALSLDVAAIVSSAYTQFVYDL